MALRVFEDTFGRRKVTRSKVQRSKSFTQEDYLRAVAEAVQSVVDTFRDPMTGDRYIVTTGPAAEAYTKMGEKAIRVSHKPLFDKALRIATSCTIMTGFTLHEVGHTLYTAPYLDEYKAAFGDPGLGVGYYAPTGVYDKLAWSVMNIGDDALLENRFAARFPIARDCFPTMLHWVAIHTGMLGERVEWSQGPTKVDTTKRVNFIIFATRYPWVARWSPDPITRAERKWWQEWSRRYIATEDADAQARIELTREALARLRSPEREEPPVEEPPKGDEPPGGCKFPVPPTPKGEGDEDEDGEERGTNPGSDFEDDESDEDEDEDGEERGGSGDEDDESEDEDDPRGWGDDEDEDSDEDDEDEDEPAPKGDGKSGDEPTEDEDETPKPETGDETVPEGPKKFPEDFDAHSIRGDIDKTVRGEDYMTSAEGRMVQRILNEERRNERTDVGLWGKATITITDLH